MLEPRVVLMSLWRNDEHRSLAMRIGHLLGKTYPNLRWVWVVGDSHDHTEQMLRDVAELEHRVEVVRFDSGLLGDDPEVRLQCLSLTANAGFDCVRADDDYWLIHESDIVSPPNLVELFLATGKCPVAGWPKLGELFYDTWAYRKEGVKFSNTTPKPDGLVEMDSVGTCWMFQAEDLRAGLRIESGAAVELCNRLRERGRQIWVDPQIEVVQPIELWVAQRHSKVV